MLVQSLCVVSFQGKKPQPFLSIPVDVSSQGPPGSAFPGPGFQKCHFLLVLYPYISYLLCSLSLSLSLYFSPLSLSSQKDRLQPPQQPPTSSWYFVSFALSDPLVIHFRGCQPYSSHSIQPARCICHWLSGLQWLVKAWDWAATVLGPMQAEFYALLVNNVQNVRVETVEWRASI